MEFHRCDRHIQTVRFWSSSAEASPDTHTARPLRVAIYVTEDKKYLFTDFHQSGNGIVPVTGQTQYFGHQPDCFQTEFLISQMMIAHDREVGVLMHSDNR